MAKDHRKRRKNVVWYVNPLSWVQTLGSIVLGLLTLDVYSRKETGKGVFTEAHERFDSWRDSRKKKRY